MLNLKMIRNFVLADEPVLPLKTELKSILTSTSFNSSAENFRRKLAQEFENRPFDFSYGQQVHIGDIMTATLESLGLQELSQYKKNINKKCFNCHYSWSESVSGALHHFLLKESTEKMIENQETNQFECPNCADEDSLCEEKVSISDTKRYLLIACGRTLDDQREVYPTEELTMDDGSCYQVKSVINYKPGCTRGGEESGHYTASLYIQNQWYEVNDMNITQMESPPTKGMVFFYELMEEQTDEEPSNINLPVHFDNEVLNNSQPQLPEEEDETVPNQVDKEEGLQMLSRQIGRLAVVAFNVHQQERFHLRNILYAKPGPKSFEDLRTVNGVVYPTYQQAAIKMGLWEDDTAIEQALEEAFTIKFGRAFRQFFAIMMIHSTPADPLAVYQKFESKLCEDFMPKDTVLAEPTEVIKNKALNELNALFNQLGFDMVDKFKLPPPTDVDYRLSGDRLELQQELEYDREELKAQFDNMFPTLNEGQRTFILAIIDSVECGKGILAFLQAAGGGGKTHVLKAMMADLRSRGFIVIATATTGIGATLLPGAGTVHTKTGAPIDLHEKSMCNYPDQSGKAELIKKADLLIIDEATLGDRLLYECLDRSFQNTRKNNKPFGGCTVVFCGDWRQCLPVVPGGGPAEIMSHTLKRSYLWSKVILSF